MKKFEHVNIVRMIGVCTGQDPMYIVMELMLHGDLRGFLLGHRHLAGTAANEGPVSSQLGNPGANRCLLLLAMLNKPTTE